MVVDGFRIARFAVPEASTTRRQRGRASCGGGAMGRRCSSPIDLTILASTRAGGRLKSSRSAMAFSSS